MVKFITLVILHAHLYQLSAHDRILLLLHNSAQLLLTLPGLHSKNSLFFHHQITIPLNAHLKWTIKDQARELEQLMTLQLNNDIPNKVQFYDKKGSLAATLYVSIQQKSLISTLEPLDLIVNRLRSHQVHKSNSYLIRVSYGQNAFFTSQKFSEEAVVHWKQKYAVQKGTHKYLFLSVWSLQDENKVFKAWGNISFDQMQQRQSLNVQLQLKGENGAFGSLWLELIRKQEDRLLKLYVVEVLPQQWTFPQELYFLRIKLKNQKYDSRSNQARPYSLQLQQEIKLFLTDSHQIEFQLIQFARQRLICSAFMTLTQLQNKTQSPIEISLQSKNLRNCKLYVHLGKSLNRVRNKITRQAQRVQKAIQQPQPQAFKDSDGYKYSFTFQEYREQPQSLTNADSKAEPRQKPDSLLLQQASSKSKQQINLNQTPFSKQKLPLIPQRSTGNLIKASAVEKRAKSNNQRSKPKYVYRQDPSQKSIKQMIIQQTLSKRPELLENPKIKNKHSIAVNTMQVLERNLKVYQHSHHLADHRSMVNVIERINIHPFKKEKSISLNPILKANVFPSQVKQRPASRLFVQDWYQIPIQRRKYQKEPASMIDLVKSRFVDSRSKQPQEQRNRREKTQSSGEIAPQKVTVEQFQMKGEEEEPMGREQNKSEQGSIDLPSAIKSGQQNAQLQILQFRNTLFQTLAHKFVDQEFKVVATAKLKLLPHIDRIQVSAQVLQALKEGLDAMWASKARNQREFMGLFLRRWSGRSQELNQF